LQTLFSPNQSRDLRDLPPDAASTHPNCPPGPVVEVGGQHGRAAGEMAGPSSPCPAYLAAAGPVAEASEGSRQASFRATRPPGSLTTDPASMDSGRGHMTARSTGSLESRPPGENISELSINSALGITGPSGPSSIIADRSVDTAPVSMPTNSVHQAHRPPMIDVNVSENGSVAAASGVYTARRHVEVGGAIPAVTNDITVVDADQHMQDDQAQSEMHRSEMDMPFGMQHHFSALGEEWRAVKSAPAKWWLTQVDGKAVEKAQPHSDWWYDTDAIMSRKPSVRFRRSVDIPLPFYDENVRLDITPCSFSS
jgi:hypothetical protein